MELRKGRHPVFELHAHLIFITKYRGKVFNAKHLKSLHGLLNGVCESFDVERQEFNGESDHVHLMITYPPTVTLSKLVNSLKGASSRRMKRLHPELQQPAYLKNALWSGSYYAGSCGGAPIDVLRRYIEQQNSPR